VYFVGFKKYGLTGYVMFCLHLKMKSFENKEKVVSWYQQDLNSHFQDICIYEATISVFSMPLNINVETVPANSLTSTNSCLPADRFPVLSTATDKPSQKCTFVKLF
jgi:hypothetical protein